MANKSKVVNVQGQTCPQSSDRAQQVQRVLSSDIQQKMSNKEYFEHSSSLVGL